MLMPAKRQVTEQKTLVFEKSGAAVPDWEEPVERLVQMRERRNPESNAWRMRTSWLKALGSYKEYPPTATCLTDGYLAEREKVPGLRLTVTLLDMARAARRR